MVSAVSVPNPRLIQNSFSTLSQMPVILDSYQPRHLLSEASGIHYSWFDFPGELLVRGFEHCLTKRYLLNTSRRWILHVLKQKDILSFSLLPCGFDWYKYVHKHAIALLIS